MNWNDEHSVDAFANRNVSQKAFFFHVAKILLMPFVFIAIVKIEAL